MKKRMYRAVHVKHVDLGRLAVRAHGPRIVVGVDVAKKVQFAALLNERYEVLLVFKWNQLDRGEHDQAVELIRGLPASSVEVVTEPSGTYGDALCAGLRQAGVAVFRVGPQRSQKYAEVYDGVPSQHDGKSAVLLARLHLEGMSQRLKPRSVSQRDLAAAASELDYLQEHRQRTQNRLEAQLARHWPELSSILSVDGVSILTMLASYGDPRVIADAAARTGQDLRRIGGHYLRRHRIEAILESARTTIGVVMSDGERRLMQRLAQEILRTKREIRELERRLEALSRHDEVVTAQRPLTGLQTAVVLSVKGGDPRECPHPAAFLKRLGLNLKEHSSGRHQGQLRLSKRGSGAARRWLYLLMLRLLQRDGVIRAWYQRKVARDAGLKSKALTAVMRKVAKALWHVARGAEFQAHRLFDTRRLAAP